MKQDPTPKDLQEEIGIEEHSIPDQNEDSLNFESFRAFKDEFDPLLVLLQFPRKVLLTAPTFTPRNFLESIQFHKSGSTYYIDTYIDNAWQSAPYNMSGAQTGSVTQSLPAFTNADTVGSHDFGFVPKLVIGQFRYAGVPWYWGAWVNGFEFYSMAIGNRSDSPGTFCTAASSIYLSGLSVSGTTLSYHYKNTGNTGASVDLIALG